MRAAVLKRYLASLPTPLLSADDFSKCSPSPANSSEDLQEHLRLLADALCGSVQSVNWLTTSSLLPLCPMISLSCLSLQTEPTEFACRWAIICFLLEHVRRIEASSGINKMSFTSLAICLAPSLFGQCNPLDYPKLASVLSTLFEHWPTIAELLLRHWSQMTTQITLPVPFSILSYFYNICLIIILYLTQSLFWYWGMELVMCNTHAVLQGYNLINITIVSIVFMCAADREHGTFSPV